MSDFQRVVDHHEAWSEFSEQMEGSVLGRGNPAFRFGVATSMFQDSGSVHCPNSQWTIWERRSLDEKERSGNSVSLFHLYKSAPDEVIKRLKLLKVNTYRFSVEWSHLEPEEGQFDEAFLTTYVDFCKRLRDEGIEPMVTLHHFSEPAWFHKRGSFEKEENIDAFLKFCEWVFPKLSQKYGKSPLVEVFFTINEPAVEAYCRYLVGHFSPNLRMRFKRGAIFLLNMMRAHCRVYESLHCDGVKIGICHQYLKFTATSFFLLPLTRYFGEFHNAVLHFFETGEFKCHMPLVARVIGSYEGRPPVDIVGVQFYARIYVGLGGLNSLGKEKTRMHGVFEDPEGLYEAIVETHRAFNVPVIVTENGISTLNDEQRARYLSRALFAAEKARQEIGEENLLGYILWSFSDNFEWSQGWGQNFGAFTIDQERKLNPTYKSGVQPLVDAIDAWTRAH